MRSAVSIAAVVAVTPADHPAQAAMAAALPGPRPERLPAPAARHVHLSRILRPDL